MQIEDAEGCIFKYQSEQVWIVLSGRLSRGVDTPSITTALPRTAAASTACASMRATAATASSASEQNELLDLPQSVLRSSIRQR